MELRELGGLTLRDVNDRTENIAWPGPGSCSYIAKVVTEPCVRAKCAVIVAGHPTRCFVTFGRSELHTAHC